MMLSCAEVECTVGAKRPIESGSTVLHTDNDDDGDGDTEMGCSSVIHFGERLGVCTHKLDWHRKRSGLWETMFGVLPAEWGIW